MAEFHIPNTLFLLDTVICWMSEEGQCLCVWDSGSAARDERGVKRLLGRILLITTWLCSTLVQLLLLDSLGIDGKLIQSGDEACCFVSWPQW